MSYLEKSETMGDLQIAGYFEMTSAEKTAVFFSQTTPPILLWILSPFDIIRYKLPIFYT